MINSKSSINDILHDQLTGRISKEDHDRLQRWLGDSSENREQYELLMRGTGLMERFRQYDEIDEERAWKRFEAENLKTRRFSLAKAMRYAAIFILPIVGALWFWLGKEADSKPALSYESQVSMIRSERSGKQKAMLVLSSGQEVVSPSSLVQSMPSPVVQPRHAVTLKDKQKEASAEVDNNKLMTYRDSEFWITFEDGTKVHMNYNTTLKYPSHFSGTDRTVYLDGEAYFLVAKDSKRPFMVVTANGIVKQYGTSFNVSTHGGVTKVVLVEGDISVLATQGSEFKMKPGELAILQAASQNTQISKVNIEPYIAWNEGRFVFEDCSLEDLMNVISSWYGKSVTFESEDIKNIHFTGDVDRYQSITPMVKAIQRVTGLHVEVTDKELILSNRNNNH